MQSPAVLTTKERTSVVRRLGESSDLGRVRDKMIVDYPSRVKSILLETILAIFTRQRRSGTGGTSDEPVSMDLPAAICTSWCDGASLVDIAEDIKISPVRGAKTVLRILFKWSDATRSKGIYDTCLIKDDDLLQDLIKCIATDNPCGARHSVSRHFVGKEYEAVLMSAVRNLGAAYETEAELNDRGCHKTPDVLFKSPIGVNGKTVRWIDSKARFGDPGILNEEYEASMSSYINYYGSGLVIFWFGFVGDCESAMRGDAGVLCLSDFPKDIVVLPDPPNREA